MVRVGDGDGWLWYVWGKEMGGCGTCGGRRWVVVARVGDRDGWLWHVWVMEMCGCGTCVNVNQKFQ